MSTIFPSDLAADPALFAQLLRPPAAVMPPTPTPPAAVDPDDPADRYRDAFRSFEFSLHEIIAAGGSVDYAASPTRHLVRAALGQLAAAAVARALTPEQFEGTLCAIAWSTFWPSLADPKQVLGSPGVAAFVADGLAAFAEALSVAQRS